MIDMFNIDSLTACIIRKANEIFTTFSLHHTHFNLSVPLSHPFLIYTSACRWQDTAQSMSLPKKNSVEKTSGTEKSQLQLTCRIVGFSYWKGLPRTSFDFLKGFCKPHFGHVRRIDGRCCEKLLGCSRSTLGFQEGESLVWRGPTGGYASCGGSWDRIICETFFELSFL